jgi:hypothetical protein
MKNKRNKFWTKIEISKAKGIKNVKDRKMKG